MVALRDRAFETPLARRWREEKEEREEQERLEAEHQAEIEREPLKIKAEIAELRLELAMRRKEWEAEFAERKLRADIAWERFKAALMRGDFAPRRKANFNPNQQRVPAGNPDGGQWTDDGGARSANNPQFVQDRTDRPLNNHILRNHVAKTDEELKARIRAEQLRGLFVRSGMDRNGSFDSIESARDFISQTIANNPGDVARVASGETGVKFLTWRFHVSNEQKVALRTFLDHLLSGNYSDEQLDEIYRQGDADIGFRSGLRYFFGLVRQAIDRGG